MPPPPPPPGLTAPSGYVAFQNAPTPSGQLQRVGGLAKWAMIATAMSGLVGIVSTVLVIPVLDKASGFVDGSVTDDEFNDAYLPSQLLSTLGTVVSLAAGVFTILWMYRVAANLRVFSRMTTFAPVFAVVGWMLPPFLYVLPFLILRELWKASDPGTPVADEGWRRRPVTPLLTIWFIVYGIVPAALQAVTAYATVRSLLDGGVSAANSTRVTAEALDASGWYTVAAGVVTAVAAVIWIMFVKQLTARHVQLTGET
ncbi:MAG: DUF4328 domain-containing protein [Ilumatobacter sp.]|uniref:DUF4328 domain-containing protein n=1 Tax=Ilumatobacter sp. TaxID=1967498 RepID=UPI003C78BBD7